MDNYGGSHFYNNSQLKLSRRIGYFQRDKHYVTGSGEFPHNLFNHGRYQGKIATAREQAFKGTAEAKDILRFIIKRALSN